MYAVDDMNEKDKNTYSYNFKTDGFKKSECISVLIEPDFNWETDLEKTAKDFMPINMKNQFNITAPAAVAARTAAYMCDYNDYEWPESSEKLELLQKKKKEAKKKWEWSVKLVNLGRLLVEATRPQDTVIVKMDIEGSEYDILPCLAKNAKDANSPAKRIDYLYVEDHCHGFGVEQKGLGCFASGLAGNSKDTFMKALDTLQKEGGVQIPDKNYYTPMLVQQK